MPEHSEKRRSWWGILGSSERFMTHTNLTVSSQPDLLVETDFKGHLLDEEAGRMMTIHGVTNGNISNGSLVDTNSQQQQQQQQQQHHQQQQQQQQQQQHSSLRRTTSKMDLFKKNSFPKRNKTKGGSKFATITTGWSSSRSNLQGRAPMGSSSNSSMDINHFEKESLEGPDDTLIFMVTEQLDYLDGERDRDVAYNIRAESVSHIILLTRRISDFLEFDEKIRIQYPKSRPTLPLLEDRRKSFLFSTRQFFFPRKNMCERLEAYLRKVASHEPLRSSALLKEFLSVIQDGDIVHPKEPTDFYRYSFYRESKSDVDISNGNSHSAEMDKDMYWQQQQALSQQQQLEGNGTAATAAVGVTGTVGSVSSAGTLISTGTSVMSTTAVSHEMDDKDMSTIRKEFSPRMRGNRVRPSLPQVQERKKVTLDDFQLIQVLGRGCMGKVMLVREHKSKKLFAMKAISKEWVILQREVEHTKSERNILANVARISHPFLIRLRHSFQSNAQLFMVLDYYPGGDMATQLAKFYSFEPARCLFYTAEIVLGVEELHRLGIVYRDLKPENILLAMDGHIVLTDFGLSKQFPTMSEDKTNTFCGTAEYLAPEILRADEYSYAVDWWSLGTLLYEMLTGITPFWAENHAQMYRRVLEDELEFPPEMDPDAMSLISGFLERDPNRRLGSRGASYVKAHPYFQTIDWDLALKRKLPCPFVPDLVSELDLSNFDETFLTMTPRFTPGNHILSASVQNCFQGYSYSDKMANTLPRSDSKIRLDRASFKEPSSESLDIEEFDQERGVMVTRMETNTYGRSHGQGHHMPMHRSPLQRIDSNDQDDEDDSINEDYSQGDLPQTNGQNGKATPNHPHRHLIRQDEDGDYILEDIDGPGPDDIEADGYFYQSRPLTAIITSPTITNFVHSTTAGSTSPGTTITASPTTPTAATQLYAPPSAAISTRVETKAQVSSPALTPPTSFPDDGRMHGVERISTSRMGAAADILRGYSERSSFDTQRHNSTGSSHSSGTIGRRLSRGYL